VNVKFEAVNATIFSDVICDDQLCKNGSSMHVSLRGPCCDGRDIPMLRWSQSYSRF
jgi:hypothetical protein